MPAPRADMADRLNSATVHLGRALRQASRADRGAEGLSAELRSALTSLVYRGPMAIGTLAKTEGVSAPAMTKTVGLLEARGLVVREADSNDGRIVRLSATRRARALVARRRQAQVARIREALLAVEEGPAQVERAIQVLERLVSHLERQTP